MDIDPGELRRKSSRRLMEWPRTEIYKDQHLLEVELIALALTTGIIDAVSFPKFRTFTSNQTGNTVLFAVTAFSLFGTRQRTTFNVPAPHLAVSLGFFCLGVFIPGQIANYFNCKFTRGWLLLTNFSQTIMVLLAAFLNFLYPSGHFEADPGTINSAPILCSIGLLAAAAGAQVAMSRQLGMPEIPTTQATAAYVDLFVDPNFFAGTRQNRSRNRRILFILTLCVGSFIGAPAYHYSSTALALFLGGCIKIVVTGLFCFNSSQMERRISKIDEGAEESPSPTKRALDTL